MFSPATACMFPPPRPATPTMPMFSFSLGDRPWARSPLLTSMAPAPERLARFRNSRRFVGRCIVRLLGLQVGCASRCRMAGAAGTPARPLGPGQSCQPLYRKRERKGAWECRAVGGSRVRRARVDRGAGDLRSAVPAGSGDPLRTTAETRANSGDPLNHANHCSRPIAGFLAGRCVVQQGTSTGRYSARQAGPMGEHRCLWLILWRCFGEPVKAGTASGPSTWSIT